MDTEVAALEGLIGAGAEGLGGRFAELGEQAPLHSRLGRWGPGWRGLGRCPCALRHLA
jgi:hypothetical protein